MGRVCECANMSRNKNTIKSSLAVTPTMVFTKYNSSSNGGGSSERDEAASETAAWRDSNSPAAVAMATTAMASTEAETMEGTVARTMGSAVTGTATWTVTETSDGDEGPAAVEATLTYRTAVISAPVLVAADGGDTNTPVAKTAWTAWTKTAWTKTAWTKTAGIGETTLAAETTEQERLREVAATVAAETLAAAAAPRLQAGSRGYALICFECRRRHLQCAE